MAEHRLPPSPAPAAAPIVELAALEPPPAVEEPPAVDPVLAPPPAPVLVADPAPAVEAVEEVIFLAILLVLSQIYVFYRVLPAACSFSAYVCLRFIYILFLGSFVWVYSGKPVYSFEAIVRSMNSSPFVGPLPSPSMVAACPSQASLNQLRFLSPEYFRAGEIHNHLSVWEHLLSGRGSSQVDLMEIIKEGVRIDRLFKPFKGNFKGSSYDTLFPPPMRLDNAKVCDKFRSFITDTVVDWVDAGVLAVWGRVGEVTSPHLVLPLTVEPSKPRLCHDERFLNLWVKDPPFKLDHLPDLPRYVLPGHFQASFDDKSGY